jgi:hypothetical protein
MPWSGLAVRNAVVLAATLASLGGRAHAVGAQARTQPAAARPFIGRILGVFDSSTGDPIDGVEVLDLVSKMSALTTSTGTVALSFVDSAGSMLRLRKPGYEPQVLTISNHEGEVPLTVILRRAMPVLPAVVTTAVRNRGPADTVRRLDLNGFYDRRDRSGASPIAFVLGERIRDISTFDDFEAVTGRPICVANMYVDGARVLNAPSAAGLTRAGSGRVARNLRKNALDQIVDPTHVLAIENYRVGEVPVEYNSTKDADAGHACGATLIWTK